MHKLEKFLLQLTIILIPINLSWHYYIDKAYINGRLVDYLIPKLYISDLPIFSLLIIFIFNYLHSIDLSTLFKRISKFKPHFSSLILFIFIQYLLVLSLVSTNPISSFWYVFKIIEFVLLSKYLSTTYTYSSFLKVIFIPLILGLILQFIIVLYQYINHTSAFEYYIFGETNLSNIDVVKTGIQGALEVVPYGTTPHPNLLAGFVTFSSILLLIRSTLLPKQLFKKTVLLLVISLSIFIFSLTQSFSSLSGLILTLLFYKYIGLISIKSLRLLFLMYIIITPILILIFLNLNHHYNYLTDSPSFTNRYELNYAAIRIMLNKPLSGVGPNLFTANLPIYPVPGQQSYFLQPVHNWLLLVLSETGFIGFSLLLINLIIWLNSTNPSKASKTSFLPFWFISTILFFDHYPFTLQTGQLLLTLAFVLPTLSASLQD